MAQLIKHYFKTLSGDWATNLTKGLVMPRIEGLDVKYWMTDSNGVQYMLSHVPETKEVITNVGYHDYSKYGDDGDTPIESQLEMWKSDNNITGIITTEQYTYEEINDIQIVEAEQSGVERTGFNITHTKPIVLETSVGLSTLTEAEWDTEISTYDIRQQNKRYDAIRVTRDKMLTHTDWKVVQELETSGSVSTDFSNWRQTLRDLPNNVGFPTCYPDLPTIFENDSTLVSLTGSFDHDVRSIVMINDPLPELEIQ